MWLDQRIPIAFDEAAQPDPDRLLMIAGEAEAPLPEIAARWAGIVRLPGTTLPTMPHDRGCRCCLPRSLQVAAIGALLHARARGEVRFFRSVVVDLPPEQAAILREALARDPIANACFRQEQADWTPEFIKAEHNWDRSRISKTRWNFSTALEMHGKKNAQAIGRLC